MTLSQKIKNIKSKKNAIVLAHNYQKPEIHEIADFIGDSLELCQMAAKTSARLIVFCGVSFMAETAKILNPDKKVVVPYLDAGCAMADMVDVERLRDLQKRNPDAVTVCYINSTAEVKACSYICCTSSNAIKIVRSLPQKKIIFVPDKNLADYIAVNVPEKEIIAYDGYCPAHHFIDKEALEEVRRFHPSARIIAHPESKPEILKVADYISSTSGMIACAKSDSAREFFVLTECGMIERLKSAVPGKKFFGVCNMCFDMKKTTLQSVLDALVTEKNQISVDKVIAGRARKTIERMFEVQ